MCGLFGFISKAGGGPDLDRLRRIALETQTRGIHAFGLVWVTRDGKLHTFKRPGSAWDNLAELDRCKDALIVAGHCRYATHGDPADNPDTLITSGTKNGGRSYGPRPQCASDRRTRSWAYTR